MIKRLLALVVNPLKTEYNHSLLLCLSEYSVHDTIIRCICDNGISISDDNVPENYIHRTTVIQLELLSCNTPEQWC